MVLLIILPAAPTEIMTAATTWTVTQLEPQDYTDHCSIHQSMLPLKDLNNESQDEFTPWPMESRSLLWQQQSKSDLGTNIDEVQEHFPTPIGPKTCNVSMFLSHCVNKFMVGKTSCEPYMPRSLEAADLKRDSA